MNSKIDLSWTWDVIISAPMILRIFVVDSAKLTLAKPNKQIYNANFLVNFVF